MLVSLICFLFITAECWTDWNWNWTHSNLSKFSNLWKVFHDFHEFLSKRLNGHLRTYWKWERATKLGAVIGNCGSRVKAASSKFLTTKASRDRWSRSIESRSFKTFETQEIIRRNGTLRIFDKLGRRMHTMARHNGTTLATDKLHLFNDYSTPQPLHGVDKFDKAGVLTDYQWIIASHK